MAAVMGAVPSCGQAIILVQPVVCRIVDGFTRAEPEVLSRQTGSAGGEEFVYQSASQERGFMEGFFEMVEVSSAAATL